MSQYGKNAVLQGGKYGKGAAVLDGKYGRGGILQGGAYGNIGQSSGVLSERYIPTFDGSQFGRLASLLSLTAGDEIEVEFATTYTNGVGNHNFIFDLEGGVANPNRGYIYADLNSKIKFSTTKFNFYLDGVAATDGVTGFPVDGKVHSFKCSIIAATDIDLIAVNDVLGGAFQGQYFSFNYTKNGVRTNIPIDSGNTLYQLERGTALGGDLDADVWTYNNTDATNTVTKAANKTYTLVSDGGLALNIQQAILTASKGFEIKITATGVTGAGFKVQDATTDELFGVITSDGVHTFAGLPSDANLAIYRRTASAASSGTLKIEHVKQLPDSAVLLNGFTEAVWARYTLQRNIAHNAGTVVLGWLSNDIKSITLGVWTDNGDGSYSLVGDGLYQPLGVASVTANGVYLFGVFVDALSGGTLKLQAGGGALISELLAGENIIVGAPNTAQVDVARYVGTITATVSNLKAQHLIELT